MTRSLCRFVTLIFTLILVSPLLAAEPVKSLELKQGDHISFLGNTLSERMQHSGWLETIVQSRFPKHNLSFRNLGFSGDELSLRLRSAGFGSPDEHLTRQQTDIVFAFFGYNESFAGQAGLEKFKQDLDSFIKQTLSKKYNGDSAPQVVIFSPIAHEDLGNDNLPNGTANNERIKLYTSAMAEVTKANKVFFVDLFHPTQKAYRQVKQPLTINGIHLNDQGDLLVAQIIEASLFPRAFGGERDLTKLAKLRSAVQDKNYYWFHRYRTVDGYSMYGGRSHLKFIDGQTNRVVMMRELKVLDVMTANRDKRIWEVSQGRELKVDDDNTPPFIPVISNKPGPLPGGKHVFLGGDEALKKMTAAAGLQVNLFASEEMFPELASPVQMAFDAKGRLWVAAWPTYPHWKPKGEMNDKLLIFEDTDGDGQADKMKVFADKLHCPTGFEFYNGGVYVAQAPDLWFLKDTDGDDVADVRERVLHGLDSADTHHTSNSFTLGPGGALYFQEGTFHQTQVETPYGPTVRCSNAGVFRFEPKTRKFDVYINYGFANPHGHVFNEWGQDFVTDGTGNVNYFAAPFSGRIDYPAKHGRYFPFFQQRTRPCGGTEIISSRHFPESSQGNYLAANVIGFQGILQYKVGDDASGYKGTRIEPVVQSADPNFRPVDIEIGPDGALYIVDWQNPIIGHMQHNIRDPSRDKTHGRVYRVSAIDRPLLKPTKIAGEPIERLLELLQEPENRTRHRAKVELSSRDGGQVLAAVDKWQAALDKNDPRYEHSMLEALWVYQHNNTANEPLLRRMLRSPDYRARAAATRVLCYWRDKISTPLVIELLKTQANDEHPRVRLEAVRACSFIREAQSAEAALEALKHPTDKFLNYSLTETLRSLEPYWKPAIGSGQPFADNNPAGIEYILSGVGTAELANMARNKPVYTAMLTRQGLLHEHRHEAIMGLAKINKTDVMTELLAAIERLDKSDSMHAQHVLFDLAHMFTSQEKSEFAKYRGQIEKLSATARRPITRRIAYVTLITADQSIDAVWRQGAGSLNTLHDLIESVPLLPDAKLRASAYAKLAPLVHGLPEELAAKAGKGASGRYVRIELPGDRRTLTLAEVEIFSDGQNIARQGSATQSATSNGGNASRALDGNKNSSWGGGGQTHTPENRKDPWWEVDLGSVRPIESIVVYNRKDGQLGKRLDGFTVKVLDSARQTTFQKTGIAAPAESVSIGVGGDPIGTIVRSAINAITYTGTQEQQTFTTLARFVLENNQRGAAVRALGRIPRRSRPQGLVKPLVENIISHIEQTPAKERTALPVLNEIALGNSLTASLPKPVGAKFRKTLRELGVNVIRLRPVPHKMQYDRSQIFVEIGKPVEVIFENIDIMPHNFVITVPGALAKVGIAAEKMAAQPDAVAKQFIPNMPEVMHATRMLQPGQLQRLSFTAPNKLGEYPFVCTFPGHWRRMYGVMHVVENLDDLPAEILAPTSDPDIQSRPFVREWKLEDLTKDLANASRGRSFERGKELFTAISCVQCHRIGKEGTQIGADLAEVKKKLEGKEYKPLDVLREMVDPSAKIDQKYRTLIIEDVEGRVHTGIVAKRNDKEIQLLANPLDKKEPITIALEDIEDEFESKISMMPAGLLNTLTKEEIFDLFAFIISGGDQRDRVYAK